MGKMTDEQMAALYQNDAFLEVTYREMFEPDSEALKSVLSTLGRDAREHEGPGPHPGTKTEQTVHAGGKGGGLTAEEEAEVEEATPKLIEEMSSNPEGFSFNPLSEAHPETGYMVGIKKGPIFQADSLGDDEMHKEVSTWLKSEYDILAGKDNVYAGGWLNHDDNSYHLDISENVFEESKAKAMGVDNAEISIWDIDNSQEIRL